MTENKKLERNPMNKVVGGVCSGLADYFNLDVALVRVAFVIAALFASFGFWLYIILWIVLPENKLDINFQTPPNNETRQTYGDTQQSKEDDNRSKKSTTLFAGILVILIGLIFLINNFIPISWVWKLWPLILVVIGVVMIVNASKKGADNE
ncbi:MAG: PspC domain-containing protein [Bacteroidales bacterium]|nr:PspC domain-containing protein [Bacteroidales bacterium]